MSHDIKNIPLNYRVEFRVWDMERFGILQRFFNALKRWSEQQYSYLTDDKAPVDDTKSTRESTLARRPQASDGTQDLTIATAVNRSSMNAPMDAIDKPELWLLNLRPQDMATLGLPDHAKATQHLRDWRDMTRRERKKMLKNDDSLTILADFADMIGNFRSLEVVFLRCVVLEHDRAVIEYRTAVSSYDSRATVEELLLFFGFPHIV